MRKKKKECRFVKLAKIFLVISSIFFFGGNVYLNSLQANLNKDISVCEKEISTLKASLDGLNLAKGELTEFSRVLEIANKYNLTYTQKHTACVVSKRG